MNALRRIPVALRTVGVRQMETGSNVQPGYDKIKKAQEFFQMADGKMVHEKTQGDRMFFYFTVALTALGVAGSFHYFYKAAFPQKRN